MIKLCKQKQINYSTFSSRDIKHVQGKYEIKEFCYEQRVANWWQKLTIPFLVHSYRR